MPIINANGTQYHLSHEEEDKLNQFKNIADFPEDDLELIIKLLQNHSWNLEPALSRYFDDNWKETLTQINAGTNFVDSDTMDIPTAVATSSFDSSAAPVPGPRPDREVGTLRARHINMMDEWNSTTNLVPLLPLVKRLPIDYKEKFRIVGLNKQTNAAYGRSNNDCNPVLLILMVMPKFLWKVITILWSIITFNFFSNHNNDDQNSLMMRVPKLPTEETDSIDLDYIFSDSHTNQRTKQWLKGPHPQFNDILKDCEDNFKFLLVILVGAMPTTKSEKNSNDNNEEEQKDMETVTDSTDYDNISQTFLNKIFTNGKILDLLEKRKDNTVVYFGSVTELEPWLVARNLNVKYTPECLLIGNVLNGNGTLNGTMRLSVLAKLKLNSTKKFYNSLRVTLDKFDSELIVSRTEKEELRIAREIKQLQEQAYQDSLRKDRIKEENRKTIEQEKALQEKIKLQKEQQIKLQDTVNNLKWLKLCCDLIKDDTDSIVSGECATLQIRTSNGKRIVKKFKSDTTLHSVYCSVGCYLYLNQDSSDEKEWSDNIIHKIKELIEDSSVLCFKDKGIVEDELDQLQLKEIIESELEKWSDANESDIPLEFDFELVSPFPRFEIPRAEHTKIREVSQIWPNGSLLVEDIVESESESGSEGESI
ncbi:hypothetical protein C6P45_002585 [Maudiozyma exigua]|uniref:UBX domain-containing protein n=1 Tax=Maudiozyma exigua TaxID=34358 RepID=A0A9P6WCI4_MAUEX|nr:hypothetical protein C6P45_002585 [Kazachstania exigua]